MAIFTHEGISICYEVYGEGKPILLLHGAAVDFNYNFIQTGWVDTLTKNGYQVIGLNYRGYGHSDKSNDPAFYGTTNLSNDAINLLLHLNLKDVALMGYSMGTLIALELLHKHPDFFSKAILIATGDGLMGQPPFIFANIVPGLAKLFAYETFPSHLPTHISTYWTFFKALKLDKEAMIAFSLANYAPLSPEEVSTIETPILIISGEKDVVLGQGSHVSEKLATGEYLEITDADHFTLATNKNAHEATVAFLERNKS
jgi:pimeloyl-ACP methyl ester carboxylesterase